MVNTRQLKFVQALNEALDLCMEKDPKVFILGLGAPDAGPRLLQEAGR